MDDAETLRTCLLINDLIALPIVLYHRLRSRTGEKLDRRQEGWLVLATLRPIGVLFFVALFVYFRDPARLSWASLTLPLGLRWAGVALCVLATALLAWTLRHLGRNLTDTVAIRREHTLITHGPYRWVRHPFYVAILLVLLGHSLAAANGLLLVLGSLVLALIWIRTRKEEENLEARFGDDYRRYGSETGRFFPRF